MLNPSIKRPSVDNLFVNQVHQFNVDVIGIGDREIGLLNSKELEYAMKAISEETQEFSEAHHTQDLIGAVDAVIDLMYFSLGFLSRMGLSPEQISGCMTAVHMANMRKQASKNMSKRVEGVADAAKPEGWTGPEEAIAEILGG